MLASKNRTQLVRHLDCDEYSGCQIQQHTILVGIKLIYALNSCTSEIIEISYFGIGLQDFQKYRNFQIVNDSEFIYFIGGQLFSEERNTFNPTVKCFKMDILSGEVFHIRDLPLPKMKFGITIFAGKIYIFGGLQTIEKHRSNSCESYDISSNTWTGLPIMRKNRVCPLVTTFVPTAESLIPSQTPLIFTIGGMEDKNNINYSIEIFDTSLETWIELIEKPSNSKCYIPKQLGYAIQINPEQIMIVGGMVQDIIKGLSGRKQKPTSSLQVYNVSKKSVSNISLDSLPIGILQDFHCGQPVIHNKCVYVINTQICQYFPVLKQIEGVCNIIKIGLNQQEIIYTHVF